MCEGKVSVILPTYNRGYIITRAIQSVLRQTYVNLELIIVDDGSTDDTESIVRAVGDDRIRYIRYEINKEANHARNVGMREAVGDYIAFIDSDNEWNEDYLKEQVYWLERKDEKIDVVFARTELINLVNRNLSGIFPNVSASEIDTREKLIKKLMIECVFDTNVCMINRKVYNITGGFDEKIRRLQDWNYFLGLLFENYNFKFNDKVLCTNYVQKDSISNTGDLYWTARLCLFKKYLHICRKLGVIIDVLERMLEDSNIENMSPQNAEELFSILNAEEICDMCRKYYKKAENNLKNISIIVKNEKIIELQSRWLEALQAGKSIVDYFHNHNIKNICIYGFGTLGKLLYNELSKSNVYVKMIIDGYAESEEVNICRLEEIDDIKCDRIVVTAVAAVAEISDMLKEKTTSDIISIEEVIDEL